MIESPVHPASPFELERNYGHARREEFIAQIASAPLAMRQATAGLDESQLGMRYRNWSIRQIVHHTADSHVHSYIRFKWALTEDMPLIKAYDEDKWAALEDAQCGEVTAPLALLIGTHARWVQLLRSMSNEQFGRGFKHPESGKVITLSQALCYYAWHGQHHTSQITWLREKHGWG